MKIQKKFNERQGHWILARAGKKVLRPGGRELTQKLIENLNITSDDDVVEFAPGLGMTANLACAKQPNSYTGIDINEEASRLASRRIKYAKKNMMIADASHTLLPDAFASKVYGEAILTMQSDSHKKEIIHEASRILKPGGYFGLHELGLCPDDLSGHEKKNIQKELSENIRVNARPMTMTEWKKLLEGEGFSVVTELTHPMHLLEPGRLIKDEGFFRTLRFVFNVLFHCEIRRRVKNMRRIFRKHKEHINALAIVAKKI